MISYISGKLAETSAEQIVIESNGFGMNIRVPASVLPGLPAVGSDVKIYTYMYVREDMINLYGFLTRDDLEFFKLMLNVSGIGPKGALSVLSYATPDELRLAILTDDEKKISSAPGIGKKTAQRLVLELKDKISSPLSVSDMPAASANLTGGVVQEAIEALGALGISSSEAAAAVKKAGDTQDLSVEEIIKRALKNI